MDFNEIISDGPRKDGIPTIDNPAFDEVAEVELAGTILVISLNCNGEAYAYPLGIFLGHEIVNDRINGLTVTVTCCPFCNAPIVFDVRVGGQELEFGATASCAVRISLGMTARPKADGSSSWARPSSAR